MLNIASTTSWFSFLSKVTDLFQDVMQNELEVLEKSLELYAFRDININSPPSDGLIHVQTGTMI